MRRIFYLITLSVAGLLSSCHQTSTSEKIAANWKKIPNGWIEKVKRCNYSHEDTTLLKEFANIIKPDSLFNFGTNNGISDYQFVFNVVSADIDGDQKDELICLIGLGEESPSLCVFKEFGDSWYLIYKEEIDTFYEAPTLYIGNCFSKHKTFYLRRVYDHGSGVYIDGYSFYKLVDNRVYKCLDLTNNAHIDGWGLFMNQDIKMSFDFRGDSDDEINVDYTYSFFPGSINESDCPWCAHQDIPLINGEDNVEYVYDKKKHLYKLDIPSWQNKPENLTAQKIACFGDFGNDSLFVSAYHDQIEEKLKTGMPLQKKILHKYLALVSKNKTVKTEELELKTKAGSTSFYGPKKEK